MLTVEEFFNFCNVNDPFLAKKNSWQSFCKFVIYAFVIPAKNDFDLGMDHYQWCLLFFDQQEQEGPKQQQVLADLF